MIKIITTMVAFLVMALTSMQNRFQVRTKTMPSTKKWRLGLWKFGACKKIKILYVGL